MTLSRRTLTPLLEELERKMALARSLGTMHGERKPLQPGAHEAIAVDMFGTRFVGAMPVGPESPAAWELGEALDAMLTGMAHYAVAFDKHWELTSAVDRPLGAAQGAPEIVATEGTISGDGFTREDDEREALRDQDEREGARLRE